MLTAGIGAKLHPLSPSTYNGGKMQEVDIAIIGAGAAGLAAGKELAARNASFVLLEASHRIGGRGYTEDIAPGVPFDLGCHWLHSASLNPFVAIADQLGFSYHRGGGFPWNFLRDGKAASRQDKDDYAQFRAAQDKRIASKRGDRDKSIYEATERDSPWTPYGDHIMSLLCSVDVDQISVEDLLAYKDTGEDWPVQQGYGALIHRFGADVPVSLNTFVHAVDWSGSRVRLKTSKGELRAGKVLLTVSTGILAGGDIGFTPTLPDWKREAIAGLPLGNHNRIGLLLDEKAFGEEMPWGYTVRDGDEEPFSLQLRPFGFPYVIGMTGGRFADWLERAGERASVDYAIERLARVFGSAVRKHVRKHTVTAWRGDPWVKGAYSCALPGQAHQREALARPIDQMLYFAGEATSRASFSTAHGAYLSGLRAVEEMRTGAR